MKNNYFDIKKWRWMVPSIQKSLPIPDDKYFTLENFNKAH